MFCLHFLLRPAAPVNGDMRADGVLKVGKMITFHCKPGYMMKGQPVMTCAEGKLIYFRFLPLTLSIDILGMDKGNHVGKWAGEVPTCVRACTYPGTVIGGSMVRQLSSSHWQCCGCFINGCWQVTEVRFYYPVGATVRYSCAPGLSLNGAPMLECLGTGVWSSSVPTCGKPMMWDAFHRENV